MARRAQFLSQLKENVFGHLEGDTSTQVLSDGHQLFSTSTLPDEVNTDEVNEDLQLLGDDSDADPNYDINNESASSSSDSVQDIRSANLKRPRQDVSDGNSARCVENTNVPGTSRKGREMRKILRNSGKGYISYKGKSVEARKTAFLPNCRMECKKRISEQDQLKCFAEYWGLGSRDKRANFVASLISIRPKKTHKLSSSDIRSCSCSYKLVINNLDVPICKGCFVKSLGETKGFVETVVNKKKLSPCGIIRPDGRGLAPPKNKRTSAEIEVVNRHIDSFPFYESHYCRAETSKKYLPSNLSISKMYQLYKEQQPNPVSLTLYTQSFNNKNLSFKKPKKDTCHKCDLFEIKIQAASSDEEKMVLTAERNDHHLKAEEAYSFKRVDKDIAKSNPSKKVFTFDLQQCLPTPYLTTSVSFYKRQLWSFNLTVHDLSNDKATCFMWDESISGRGANEIASCLYRHLQTLPSSVNEVTYYSDQCGGQNKNNIVALMFLHAVSKLPGLETVNHKFLVSGHTHMECDSDHAVIERAKKRTQMKINHLNDWLQLVRIAKTKNPFVVVKMEMEHFFDFASLAKKEGPFQIKKIDGVGQQFLWAPIQWLQYRKTEQNIIFFKTSLSADEFRSVDFKKRGRPLKMSQLPLLMTGPHAISLAKKKDLMDLLPLIDSTFHDFYRNLKTNNSEPLDPDLVETNADNE